MKKLVVGVCKGRHEIPCENFVYDKEVNPLDIKSLEKEASEKLFQFAEAAKLEYGQVLTTVGYMDMYVNKYNAECVIYVTGLTVAVIAVLETALRLFASVVLMHYNKDNGEYYPQVFYI